MKRLQAKTAAELDALDESILDKERRIAEILGNIKGLLARTK